MLNFDDAHILIHCAPDLTVNKVKLQLANEEHARMGLSTHQPHSPMTFIMLGLELEELQ